MSRRCSASTSRRSCPTAAPGTTTATTVADLMIDTVERYAPGFKASVIGRQALSPLDLEQIFGLVGGDISHGAMSLDQLFWARPDARLCRLSRAAAGPLSLRRRRASRRRRHRRARPQCRARDPRRPALAPALAAPIVDSAPTPLGATRPPWQHPRNHRERRHAGRRGEDDRGPHPRHRGPARNLQSDRQPSAERRHRRARLHPVDLRRGRRARSRRHQDRERQRGDLRDAANARAPAGDQGRARAISPACRM